MKNHHSAVTRREFLGGLAATGALAAWMTPLQSEAAPLPLIKPAALREGDCVGLVAPASPAFEPSTLREGQMALEQLGYRVKVGRNAARKWGYLAGPDAARAEDLMAMFRDPEVRAIFALRGGYGTIRMLPLLDYRVIRAHPKILIGYSDITSLHLAVHKLAGIVTYHGAVATSTFNDYSTRYLKAILGRSEAAGRIETPAAALPMLFWPEQSPDIVRGPLTGGNLTLVCASLGTPYEIDSAGKVLFLEETGEEPYDLDRMLTQLTQSGKLQAAVAILVDRCARCKPAEYKPAFENTLSVEEVLEDRLAGLGVPVLYGLSIGHVADKPVLPLGVTVAVSKKEAHFALEEAAVSEK
ncbi:MAG TPA: LD-carboxypeptidase [bacterium]|nr:LD-carboxypeptidase [bacterium]HPR87506.1 LD-carboxypeptidase [bacterium]